MKRIAFWGDAGWAVGRIGRAVQKYSGHVVDIWDWSDPSQNNKLFSHAWHEYDMIIVPTCLTDYDPRVTLSPDVYRRLLVVAHCPIVNHPFFRETVCVRPGASYAGVSVEACREMERHGMGPACWLPFGADLDDFPIRHVVSDQIKRIGLIANPNGQRDYADVKGLDEFRLICDRLAIKPIYIYGNTPGSYIYNDIDLLVCCSRFEAGPLGIFEAGASGVPVLTRPVGNAQRIKGIKTFDTVDDAVRQIRLWNNHPRSLKDYATDVTNEIRENWSMEKLIKSNKLFS